MKTAIQVDTKLTLTRLSEPVKVLTVLVKAGDAIESDQPLFEYEEGKAIATYPSPRAGTVQEICAKPGDTVSASSVFLLFGTAKLEAPNQPPPPNPKVEAPPVAHPLEALSAPPAQPQFATVSLIDVGLFLYERFEWPQIVGSRSALHSFLLSQRELLDLKLVYEAASLTAFADGWSTRALAKVSKLLQASDGTPDEKRIRASLWIAHAMSLSPKELAAFIGE